MAFYLRISKVKVPLAWILNIKGAGSLNMGGGTARLSFQFYRLVKALVLSTFLLQKLTMRSMNLGRRTYFFRIVLV